MLVIVEERQLKVPVHSLIFTSHFLYVCVSVCLWVCVNACTHVYVGAAGGQKVVSGLLVLELQVVGAAQCGCWDMNTSPLDEQQALLTTDPSLQSPHVL